MPVPKSAGEYNSVKMEEEIISRWNEQSTFARSMEIRSNAPPFIFLEGPPTANGKPGIHHVVARTYKDLVCRWKTMQGHLVERKAGWDTHGLPVEIEVQKRLDLGTTGEIVEYGMEKFNQACQESVWTYEGDWRKMTERMGFWVDLDNPYVTLHNDYIESCWWSLKQMWEKGLLFQDYKVLPYCPQTGTSYSSHEVALGYKEVTEPSVFIKFKLVDDDASILAWTTTPWTLPGNVGLAVGPEVVYCKVKVTQEPEMWRGPGGANLGEELILAKDLLDYTLRHQIEIIEEFPGSDLVGKSYHPLFPNAVDAGDSETAWTVVGADFVTTTDGTGVVHTAVMYGEDDFQLGREMGFPEVHTVDMNGCFVEGVHPYLNGRYVKSCDEDIIQILGESNNLYRTQDYKHDYPHCWRTDAPLLYYAMTSWFVKMSSLKGRLIELNDQVEWAPKWVGEGRFGEWLRNVKDWAISRERFWGTPLPIWTCEECGSQHCIESREEMKERAIDKSTVPEDLHRPFVDNVKFNCTDESCSGIMSREPFVMDCWFDSGCAFFAQWHHPFENKEIFEKSFPVDYIAEGMDQTRGWFYTLLAVSTAVFDEMAYKRCLTLGLVLDKDGKKMSKSKGNVVNPWDHFEKEGADAVRWYLVTSGAPWNALKFDPAGVRETYGKFFLTLWNVYKFHADYASLDGFDPEISSIPLEERSNLDQWVLSRMSSVANEYTGMFNSWDFHKAGRILEDFLVNDVSNWYVRRSRRRLWEEGDANDKTACQSTLHDIISQICQLASPISPFVTEHIYSELNGGESVHLSEWPTEDSLPKRNQELENEMELVRSLTELGRRIRVDAKRRQRLPCSSGWIVGGPNLENFNDIISEELNIENISVENDLDRFQKIELVPNRKSLGVKARQELPRILDAISKADPEATWELIQQGNCELAGFEITDEDVSIKRIEKEGYAAGTIEFENDDKKSNISLVLDMEITPELLSKGLARDITRRIQAKRKDLDLELEDMIKLTVWLGKDCPELMDEDWGYILNETRAKDATLSNGEGDESSQEFDVDGIKISFKIE